MNRHLFKESPSEISSHPFIFQGFKVKVLFSKEEIERRVKELAEQISLDYQEKEPLLIGILKGSWIFLADLVRNLTIPVTVDFMAVSSYGSGTESSGLVKIVLDLNTPIKDKDIIVIEDILDTGLTLKSISEHLRAKKPKSIKLCVLLDKPERHRVPIQPDYIGFIVPNRFVVGYGIDYSENFRYLPYIGYIEKGGM